MSDEVLNARENLGADASPNGSAWAALVGAGVGCAGFGIVTDVSEWSAGVSRMLQWYSPAGSLSGVAGCAMVIWVGVWWVLHARWRERRLQSERKLMGVTFLLVLTGLIATFPPFYGMFVKGG